jgi:hypothetical protein
MQSCELTDGHCGVIICRSGKKKTHSHDRIGWEWEDTDGSVDAISDEGGPSAYGGAHKARSHMSLTHPSAFLLPGWPDLLPPVWARLEICVRPPASWW